MGEIIRNIGTAFNEVWNVLSLGDALITPEGRAFLNDDEKMKEFYKKLDKERETIEKENLKEEVTQEI